MERWLVYISWAVLLGIVTYRYIRFHKMKQFLGSLLLLALAGWVLHSVFFPIDTLTAKGRGSENIYFLIVLYICMLLGMAAQYGYDRCAVPQKIRPPFDFGVFIAPVFASPMIFLPLYQAFQNADVDLQRLTSGKLALFFIAFQNGFLWKDFFDRRRKMTASKETPAEGQG